MDEEQQDEWAGSREAREIDTRMEELRLKREKLAGAYKAGTRMSRRSFDKLSAQEQADFMKAAGELFD